MHMLAKDIMRCAVVTIASGASLAEAAKLMLEHGINSLPVLDERGVVVGMVGIRDVLRVPTPSHRTMSMHKWTPLAEKAQALADTTVDQVMARHVVTVGEDVTVIDVAATMANRGVHPIPVVRDGRLLGVVGRADVARALLTAAEAERDGRAELV
jgi:CBS domain-containing protein